MMSKLGIKNISHIGIAVRNLEESLRAWERVFDLKPGIVEEVRERGVKLAVMKLDKGTDLELIAPVGEESPVKKFLEKRGEGIHHFCFLVDDIEQAVKDLKTRGIRFVQDAVQKGAEGSRIIFIHPGNMNGVLIELKEERKAKK